MKFKRTDMKKRMRCAKQMRDKLLSMKKRTDAGETAYLNAALRAVCVYIDRLYQIRAEASGERRKERRAMPVKPLRPAVTKTKRLKLQVAALEEALALMEERQRALCARNEYLEELAAYVPAVRDFDLWQSGRR